MADAADDNVDKGMGSVTPQTGPRAGQKIYKTHEDSIIGGIKGLIGAGGVREGGDAGGKDAMSAADAATQGVSDAPGNSADY